MSSEIKLLPCPFCGGEAELRKINNGVYIEFDITCENRCLNLQDFSGTNKQGLINRWNTRKPMDRIVKQLEGCGCRDCEYVDMQGDCPECITCEIKEIYAHAIEIVKAGGVE